MPEDVAVGVGAPKREQRTGQRLHPRLGGTDKVAQLNEPQARQYTSHRDDDTATGHAYKVFRSDNQRVMDTVPYAAWMDLDNINGTLPCARSARRRALPVSP